MNILAIRAGYIEALIFGEIERVLTIFTLIFSWAETTFTVLVAGKTKGKRIVEVVVRDT